MRSISSHALSLFLNKIRNYGCSPPSLLLSGVVVGSCGSGVGVSVGVSVGAWVGVSVGVGSAVGVGVVSDGATVGVGVVVGVFEGVTDGVTEGVTDGVGVAFGSEDSVVSSVSMISPVSGSISARVPSSLRTPIATYSGMEG